MNLALIVSLAGVLVTPAVTYVITSRKLSGRIDTTEASKLWDEAGDMRADYALQNKELRARVESLEATVRTQQETIRTLTIELEKGR